MAVDFTGWQTQIAQLLRYRLTGVIAQQYKGGDAPGRFNRYGGGIFGG
jgi:hypothetical protein